MAKTRLFLRPNETNRNGLTSIYVRYSHQDESVDFSTNELINPQQWDGQAQVVRKSHKGSVSMNIFLQQFKNKVDEIKLSLKLTGKEPTVANVRDEFKKAQQPIKSEPKSIYALDYWPALMKYKIETERIEKGTQKQYNATLRVLQKFEEFVGSRIAVDKIDSQLYDSLVYYLYEMDNNPNTIGQRLKNFKSLCTFLFDNGTLLSDKYKKFKKPSCESFSIALNEEQLNKIFFHDLSDSKQLSIVRDIFMLACTTALRHSDFKELKPAHIQKDYIIKFINKTRTQVKIPLTDYSRHIVEKYNRVLPKVPAKFNKLVKEVARRAGLTELVEVITRPGGRVVKEYKPLYQLVSSHVGRRTWATQAISRGVPISISMKVTGHRDVKQYLAYVKNSEPAIAEVITKAWRMPETNENKSREIKENQ